jgi:hypothetical protein
MPDLEILSLNVAIVGFVQELLSLPSPSAAVTAIEILYGPEASVPERFSAQVGTGAQLSIAALLGSPKPLATFIPARVGPAAAWRQGPGALKAARALARERYRRLQAAFLARATRGAPPAAEALVRYTYGAEGRQWLWADSAKRILDRVVVLNRVALALLAAGARGERMLRLAPGTSPFRTRDFGVADDVLDVLAEALSPVAMPDWTTLAGELEHADRALSGEESSERYRSLFAELLGLAAYSEVLP